jgi:hypothetical protein
MDQQIYVAGFVQKGRTDCKYCHVQKQCNLDQNEYQTAAICTI